MKRILTHSALLLAVMAVAPLLRAQEVIFFSEGTTTTYYDQGLVNVGSMGGSTFEHTHPPGAPQYNDKIPCSVNAYRGATSLKFNYTSAADGNWRASVYRSGWSAADISALDSLSFYLYTDNELPAEALPLIGLRAVSLSGSGDVNSPFKPLSAYSGTVAPNRWVRITLPLSLFFDDAESDNLDFTRVKGIIFSQSESNGASRLLLIDEITAYKGVEVVPPVTQLTAAGYDRHAELRWAVPAAGLSYRIYASFDGGDSYAVRAETTDSLHLDFLPESARNSTVHYRVRTLFQGKESVPATATATIRDYSDDDLIDLVQRYTFRYFWEGAHPATGMALERSNGSGRTAASGATGMGLMAMIVAHEREYRPREEVKTRILKILQFLESCDRHHGAWSHWYNADTYRTQPFSADDDGGDIVETSFVAAGLIALKNYFTGSDAPSAQIRETADRLWRGIEWSWYRNGGQQTLFWHWSPNYGFQKNMKVTGWNECLVTYLMAAASPTYGIPKTVYDSGWARNGSMVNLRTYYGYDIRLSPDWGGPLFWIHYTHLGINPRGLKDAYADYWQEHVNTAKIHHAYAIANPGEYLNYSDKNWGLTASDSPGGYRAHRPMYNDNGTISPTAALASMPYTPDESLRALKYIYRERGSDLFGIYGPYDAFNDQLQWVQKAYIGIDQGPIVVMLENYRTGLLWQMVMRDPEVQAGLTTLGFQYEPVSAPAIALSPEEMVLYPNPARERVTIALPGTNSDVPVVMKVYATDGRMVAVRSLSSATTFQIDCTTLPPGIYLVTVEAGTRLYRSKLLIQKE